MQAIHWAADNCDVDALRRELERGVDPDIIEGTWTPLQFLPFSRGGCSAQALQCYRLLLENGADVNVRDAVDDTKLHDASLTNNAELVALLLEAGAEVDVRNSQQNTPLHQATRLGGVESARLLLRAGAALNVENEFGDTPLSGSLRTGYERNFRVWPILLRAGANLPAETDQISYYARQYIQKVIDAGGWANYERRHLDQLTAMLTPKDQTDERRRSRRRQSPLRRVPHEVLRKIAAFAFHAGFY